MAGRKVWAADEILAAADLQSYIQDQVVFVFANSSARASGILAPTEGMVSYLQDTNLLYTFDGASWVEVAPNVGTAGTYTKVTTDAKGRVSAGTTLSAADIPVIDSSKVTTGSFGSDRITGNFDYRKITVDGGPNIIDWSNGAYVAIANGSHNGLLTLSNGAGACLTANNQIFTSVQFRTTGTVWADGNVRGGSISGDNSISCGATYNQTNTPARAMYVNSDGLYGIGASSRRFKKNIVDAKYDVDTIRQILVRNFEYKAEFGGNGTQEVGIIAEELAAIGLEDFVYFEDDGQAKAVAYDKLALLALSLAQNIANRVDTLEARLSVLEGK